MISTNASKSLVSLRWGSCGGGVVGGEEGVPSWGSVGRGALGGGPFILRHFHTNNVLRVIAGNDAPKTLYGPALSLQPSPFDADPEPFGDLTVSDCHRHPTPPNTSGGARWA